MRPTTLLLLAAAALLACATPSQHGTISTRTLEAAGTELCEHRVPASACVLHHPELAAAFKAGGDWCAEHERPESQCLLCHPDLTFDALPTLPASADLAWLSRTGEAVGALEAHAVRGKVTVFDFYADWCAPCRKVDRYLYEQLARRADVAVRKLNVVNWETELAKEQLGQVPSLPYLLVHGPDGRLRARVVGFDLEKLDAAVKEASR